MILGIARVYYADAKAGIDLEHAVSLLAPCGTGPIPVDWEAADECELTEQHLLTTPPASSSTTAFDAVPAPASRARSFEEWKKSLVETIFRSRVLTLFRCASMKQVSAPGETEQAFRLRLNQIAREARDQAADRLRAKYAPKALALEDRLRRAQHAVEVQKQQASQAKVQTAISFGSAVLSAFLGRKLTSAGNVGRAATAARGVGRSVAESADVGRAEESVEAVRARLAQLEADMQTELDTLAAKCDAAGESLDEITIKPRKNAITVRAVVLAWMPE